MPNTGFGDVVHDLDADTIDDVVTKTSAGAYALTRKGIKDGFVVYYVGRSDTDLKARLKQHAADGIYSYFKAGYCASPKAAFEKECQLYHDFGGSEALDNTVHPARPNGSNWTCPRCYAFG